MIKTLGVLAMAAVLVVLLVAAGLMVYHNKALREEAALYPPPGQLVQVNNRMVHVYGEGQGEVTLVFMAGHGTMSPVLDFKPLWSKLEDEHRVVVVERPGYGWSDVSNSPKDMYTLLHGTREALQLFGGTGPYILFPHSMSGLEALYWAQQYPDEVKAIVGLDPVVPESVEAMGNPPKAGLYFMYALARTGLTRFMPEADIGQQLPLMATDGLTDVDKETYMALFYRSAFTKDMLREVGSLKDNAKTVATNLVPQDVPMYFFISSEQEKAAPGWKQALNDYITQIVTGKTMELDTGHYLHYEQGEVIVEEVRKFMQEIDR